MLDLLVIVTTPRFRTGLTFKRQPHLSLDMERTRQQREQLNRGLTYEGQCGADWAKMAPYLDNWLGQYIAAYVSCIHVLP